MNLRAYENDELLVKEKKELEGISKQQGIKGEVKNKKIK